MKSSFGCAKTLFDGKIHPRLFCGPEDLLQLRKKIRTGYGLKLMNALRDRVRPLLDAVETADSLPPLIAHHTVRTHPRGGSVLAALMTLLAVKGDPGVPDLTEEESELLRMFEASLFCGIGPNGYPAEDIAYGSGMVSFMARLVEPLRRAGLYDAYALPRYRRFGRAMLHFVQPWGKFLSNTGDYGADFGWRSPVFPRLAAETRDPALLWLHGALSYPIACAGPRDMKTRRVDFPELKLAPGFQAPVDLYSLLTLSDLRKPAHPSKTSIPTQFMDPDRGIVTFRSSWKPDATFVVFDGAQRLSSAQGHAHDSGGHFSCANDGIMAALEG
ncbi:MAG: hypothetical protein HYV36_02360 [Lentisphaerae bacterium]|nr:hypothetical protein [Lentisphaerota bacterium]